VFIGHVPAGYLATSALLDRAGATGPTYRQLLAVGLAASVLPDADLLYFYLIDQRRQAHHAYLPHLPLVWVATLGAVASILWLRRSSRTTRLFLGVVGANVLLHLVLDSVAGGVRWLWPWSDTEFRVVDVPARHRPWYLNFVLHWTFWLEIALTLAAAWVFQRRRSSGEPALPAP
jgi:inner membrane protein